MFKDFNQQTDVSIFSSDISKEFIYLSGALFSGSAALGNNFYTKSYSNINVNDPNSGSWYETIYDGSPSSLSSSALCDITFGISVSSSYYADPTCFLKEQKKRVYEIMAENLLGNKSNIFTINGVKKNELFFFCLKKSLFKDGIAIDRNFSIYIEQVNGPTSPRQVGSYYTYTTISSTEYSGRRSELKDDDGNFCGILYYDLGIAAIDPTVSFQTDPLYWSGSSVYADVVTEKTIDNIVDGAKNKVIKMFFNNNQKNYKSYYFCRALKDEFNFSTNPTFLNGDTNINIRTVGNGNLTPSTYITKLGLYDINGNLLAIASFPTPIRKDFETELIIRANLNW